MLRKIRFVFVLAVSAMALAACGSKTPDKNASVTPDAIATATPTPTGEASATPTESPAKPTEGPAEPSPTVAPKEKSGDVVILFTSDVHCGVDQGFGYAGLWEIRKHLEEQGDEVILVDCGDNIQGEPLGTMTRGEVPVSLMNQMGYDIAIPGNHEFDYGMEQFLALTKKADFPYISCNFNYKGELVLKSYVVRELGGKKVAFVGVTTPETLTSSTPGYFMDENKEYVYGFFQDTNGEGLYKAVQEAVDSARAEGAEFVVVMGHLGNEAECRPWTYADLLSHTNGISVMLDGHSHDRDTVKMKNKDGSEVTRVATGTKLEGIGWVRIAADGKLTTGLYSWENKDSAPSLLNLDNEMSRAVTEAGSLLDKSLGEKVAKSTVNLVIYDPVAVGDDDKPIRIIRRMETNLGDLCADAYRAQSGADIAFVNGGGIRATISEGDITLSDILSIHPYGNYLCVVEVSGQQILDALEWGARSVPGENGGFLQVSGLSYEIDATVESPCVGDEHGMFTEIKGARRVRNVLVGGTPIDPVKKYTLAGHSYMLLESGDGFTMLGGAKLLQNCVKLDNQVLIDFIRETLQGVIGDEYADPYGEGRIVITDSEE